MWFAVHAAVVYDFTENIIPQSEFHVYENVYLIEAESPDLARNAATNIVREEISGIRFPSKIDERPALPRFAGIRKVMLVSTLERGDADKVAHGTEATYAVLYFDNISDFEKYLAGDRSRCELL